MIVGTQDQDREAYQVDTSLNELLEDDTQRIAIMDIRDALKDIDQSFRELLKILKESKGG